jgi:hypothetical protein
LHALDNPVMLAYFMVIDDDALPTIIRPDLQNGRADRIKTAPGRTGLPPVRLARRSTQLLTTPFSLRRDT